MCKMEVICEINQKFTEPFDESSHRCLVCKKQSQTNTIQFFACPKKNWSCRNFHMKRYHATFYLHANSEVAKPNLYAQVRRSVLTCDLWRDWLWKSRPCESNWIDFRYISSDTQPKFMIYDIDVKEVWAAKQNMKAPLQHSPRLSVAHFTWAAKPLPIISFLKAFGAPLSWRCPHVYRPCPYHCSLS